MRPRGLKGTCKIQLFTSDFSTKDLDSVFLCDKETAVESSQFEGNFAYFKFEGVDDIDAAELLRGKVIYLAREKFLLPQGRYLISDLIGIEVFSGSAMLGKLCDVLQYGSADVYVVKGENGEVLFPALKSLILNIDLKANKMSLDEKVFEEVAVKKE